MSDEARLILGGDKDEIIRRLYGEANVTLHDLDVMREQLRAARRDLSAALRVVRAARLLRVRQWQFRRPARARGRTGGDADARYRACCSAEHAYDAALTAYVKEGAR